MANICDQYKDNYMKPRTSKINKVEQFNPKIPIIFTIMASFFTIIPAIFGNRPSTIAIFASIVMIIVASLYLHKKQDTETVGNYYLFIIIVLGFDLMYLVSNIAVSMIV